MYNNGKLSHLSDVLERKIKMNDQKEKQIRRWLSSYKIMKKTVKLKEKHLDDFITVLYNPLKDTTGKIERPKDKEQETALSIMKKMEAIYVDIITDLENDILDMKTAIQEIFDVINELDNFQRSVCFNRYILGNSWNDIGLQLGYEARQCQRYELSAIRKIIKEKKVDNSISFRKFE